MSWLTQSVTGRISQISGQLKDILTDSTEDVIDPNTELKIKHEKLKENEKHIETLKMELAKWQEESHELNVKCGAYEAQLEQCQSEYRGQIISKDNLIIELRKQLNAMQTNNNNNNSNILIDTNNSYQKSAFMEEFEEVMPSSELGDYINLQKEIKRLNEENYHLSSENKELLGKLKFFRQNEENTPFNVKEQDQEKKLKQMEQEIFTLRNRLQADKDSHQDEIIGIQENYNGKIKSLMNENKIECETLKERINELENKLLKSKEAIIKDATKTKSNDEVWGLNEGETISSDQNAGDFKHELKLKNEEIEQLQNQIELFSNELEQANLLITRLKNLNKEASPPKSSSESDEINYKQKIALLKKKLNEVNETHVAEKASYENALFESNAKLLEQEKKIDSLTLELKQQQQSMHQEKLLQMQEEKQEGKEITRLNAENRDLKLKLDEKQEEIKQLGEQMKDLNMSIASLKSNDSSFLAELQQKTEQFLFQLDAANNEIAKLKTQNAEYAEKQKQFEFVLEEKTRETSQLKIEANQNIQHLSAQSKAMEKLQQDLKELENRETKNDELNILKQQYDQVYTYLEQKNQESLNYYNEIQRLNQVVSELTDDLQNAKNINENLNEQYDNLVKEFQLEQKMVDDLNQQTSELNNTLMSTTNAMINMKLEPEEKETKVESNMLGQDMIIKQEDEKVNESPCDYSEKFRQLEENNRRVLEQMEYELSHKNQECLDYLTEIKRLNQVVTDMNNEISSSKNNDETNAELNRIRSKRDEINAELNRIRSERDEINAEFNRIRSERDDLSLKIQGYQNELKNVQGVQEETVNKFKAQLSELNSKLEETVQYYESVIRSQNEEFKKNLLDEEQQQSRSSKELERLREHLIEMSDSYNKEAILAEEREKQLRLALSNAQQMIQQQGSTLELSSKEIESKLEEATHYNKEIRAERDKLKDRLKQTEESLAHQVKVTKNLELVLERIQNEKESQNSIEILRYQQTIKEQALTIHTLQNEIKNYQYEIQDLKESVEAASLVESQLDKKDDLIKHLQTQVNSKDALIDSYNKKVNEIQKVNDSFIEKEIIKNVIIGYIKVTQQQEKKQALKLISLMLNFTPTEIEQVESLSESKWSLTNLLTNKGAGSSSTPNRLANQGEFTSSSSGLNKSFTELLIQYVDRESKPKPTFSFDLNDPNMTMTNKKTDSPVKSEDNNNKPIGGSDASASLVRVSNSSNNLLGGSLVLNKDLSVVNRNQQQQQPTSKNAISGLASPATANNFLEQILK